MINHSDSYNSHKHDGEYYKPVEIISCHLNCILIFMLKELVSYYSCSLPFLDHLTKKPQCRRIHLINSNKSVALDSYIDLKASSYILHVTFQIPHISLVLVSMVAILGQSTYTIIV